ncbi:MAG: hypothetical protein CMK07_14895 [Ponticaulis sp.]|nr:hypothetical protein [Ponticaulis sp.]
MSMNLPQFGTNTRGKAGQSSFWQSIVALMTPPAKSTLAESTSLRIRVARPLCIFFMIWVHTNPGAAEFNIAEHGIRIADWYRFIFADGVGRTSIGLLAIASGFLAIGTARVFPFGKFAMKRVKSLLMPMVIWSAIMLCFYLLGEQVEPGYLERQVGEGWSWAHVPNWLFGITDHPANFPLGFLRDLFICALLTPVFVLAMRKAALPVLAVLFILMVTHAPTPFLGNNIPMFYGLGIWLALNGRSLEQWADGNRIKILLAFAAYSTFITGFRFYVFAHEDMHLMPIFLGFLEVQRLFGAAAFWVIAGLIAKQPWSSLISRFEPFSFFVFCSHMIILTLYWVPFQKLVGGYYHPLYPVFFTLVPIASYLTAVAGALILERLLPTLAAGLNGGRPLPKDGFARLTRPVFAKPIKPSQTAQAGKIF